MIGTTEATPAVIAPGRKLGKLPPKFDARTLRLATYIEKRKLPKVPKVHNLSRKTLKAFPDLGMMRNDELGCCTIAGLAHAEQTWSVYGKAPRRPTDEQIEEALNVVAGGGNRKGATVTEPGDGLPDGDRRAQPLRIGLKRINEGV